MSIVACSDHPEDIDYASLAYIGEISLTCSTFCILVQIIIFVWLKETTAVSVVVTIAVLWGGMPILLHWYERGS